MQRNQSFQLLSGSDSHIERIRRIARAGIYYALTGYKHSGERVHPRFVTKNYVNHVKVYQYVSQFVSGKTVLDVGCGVGYGTDLLARRASRAIGFDLSREAITEAFNLFPTGEYYVMDAEDIQFPDSSFDVIVSTENLEHLANQKKHLKELSRVIRKDGLCFIATPNPELFVGINNPHHVKENTYSELKDLMHERFHEVEIIEPLTLPDTPAGMDARDERFSSGDHGTIVTEDLYVFGNRIDQTYLSNTHSFHCFARYPITRP